VVSEAFPPVIATVPSGLAPSKNFTLPVAVEGDTVAVKVTGWPKVDAGTDDASVVVVAAGDDCPHDGNLNDPMRVFQLPVCVIAWYSCVYQKEQSSLGSMRIAE
jgi:hypothetical protein